MGSILAKNLLEEKSALPSQIKILEQSDKNRIAALKYFKNTQDLPKNYLIGKLFLGNALMSCNSDLNFSELREYFTSKGGTTAAALGVLQKNSALKNLFKDTIDNAVKRSQELSK